VYRRISNVNRSEKVCQGSEPAINEEDIMAGNRL